MDTVVVNKNSSNNGAHCTPVSARVQREFSARITRDQREFSARITRDQRENNARSTRVQGEISYRVNLNHVNYMIQIQC